jgi:hypothetical protein
VTRPADFYREFPKALRGATGQKPQPQVIVAKINHEEIPPYYHGPPPPQESCGSKAEGDDT